MGRCLIRGEVEVEVERGNSLTEAIRLARAARNPGGA